MMNKLGIVNFDPEEYIIFYVKKVIEWGMWEIYLFNKEDVFHSSSSVRSQEWAFFREYSELANVKNFEFGALDSDCILSDDPHKFIKAIW